VSYSSRVVDGAIRRTIVPYRLEANHRPAACGENELKVEFRKTARCQRPKWRCGSDLDLAAVAGEKMAKFQSGGRRNI
jgi:hypothetical protein